MHTQEPTKAANEPTNVKKIVHKLIKLLRATNRTDSGCGSVDMSGRF